MRRHVPFLVLAVLAVAFLNTATAVERDYRIFLKDGSWVQTAAGVEVVDGKVRARLHAGQLVVLPEATVDLEKTEAWNDQAAIAKITTRMPLSRNLLQAPVVLAQSLHPEADLKTEGDPRDRLWKQIHSLDEKERELVRQRTELEKQAAAYESREDALELYKQIDELGRQITVVRARRNGAALQLNGWTEQE